jgi:hypothetical protein
MKARCQNPRAANYCSYGGRGIKVCERWQQFENFLADMGERPEGQTLDRHPNNDGHYEPGNCRWATKQQQAANRRNTVTIEYRGRTQTLWAWCKELGVSYNRAWHRFDAGYPAEVIFQSEPVRSRAPTPGRPK